MRTELRIGNLVTDEFYPDFNTIITVESINEKGVNLEIESSNDWPELQSHWIEPEYLFENLRGIPLTEEWLLKFGFEKQMSWTFAIDINGRDKLVYYLGEKGWSINNKNYSDFSCEYIHKLQNLYWCLFGKELTIKYETNNKSTEKGIIPGTNTLF